MIVGSSLRAGAGATEHSLQEAVLPGVESFVEVGSVLPVPPWSHATGRASQTRRRTFSICSPIHSRSARVRGAPLWLRRSFCLNSASVSSRTSP